MDFNEQVKALGDALLAADKWLVAAESCTGGWIAKVCTDMPGSSAWFERGLVTYSNQAKQDLLGVSLSTIEAYGAVSEETVREMAAGALKNSRADFAVAVSGIAGPGGGSQAKPIGTVWFAWATLDFVDSQREQFAGDREAVRQQAVTFALDGVLNRLSN